MYKYFAGFIVLMIVFSCTENKDTFLEKFSTLDKMPTTETIKDLKFTDTIPLKDINEIFLVDVNAGYTAKFSKKEYYRIGKHRLNDGYYIVGYDSYSRPMEETSQFIAIYDVRSKTITSKLIIGSENYIKRTSEYKNGIFYITSLYVFIPEGKESQPGEDNYTRKEIVEKYRINDDFVFEKLN